MKVLLIDPPGWQKHSLSLGLAYLAGAVQVADFDVRILDMNNHVYSDERVKKIITDYNPQVIGISVKTATANISSQIIRRLKSIFPDITYVAGGPHITLCGKEFLQENPEIDLGVVGEGEVSFVKLIENIKNGRKDVSKISGMLYRENGSLVLNTAYDQPDISRLPFPVFEVVKDIDFTDFRYPLLTSRGCPYGCIFCCVGLISGKKWRFRDPEDVVNELAQAKENYQMSLFEIMDDNFTLDIGRAKKICRLIIKKKLNLSWWCHNGLRADGLDQQLLNLMKQAGCSSIALGIESGDEAVFNNINKGEKLSDIVRAVKMIKKAKIKCVGYFIVGLPGDSLASTKKSVQFQRGLGLSDYKYNILIPYPGTKIGQIVEKTGRLLADIKGTYHFGDHLIIPFETDQLSQETLKQCMHLAENQAWADGEKDITHIQEYFRGRFGRPLEKAVLVEDESIPAAKNTAIACDNLKVLKIISRHSLAEVKNRYLLKSDSTGSYWGALFSLMQNARPLIVCDLAKKRLFLQIMKDEESGYVRNEILPKPLEWDASPKRYLAARLKNNSPKICSVKNGIVYKNNIALPFSHSPQWEKGPCGKIESGLAFISRAAFDPCARYTADYCTVKSEPELQELIIPKHQGSALERVISEADVLFFPEELVYSFLVFSKAKVNAGYYRDPLRYKILDLFSMNRSDYVFQKIKSVLAPKLKINSFISQPFKIMIKVGKVLILWIQILSFRAWANIKNSIFNIARC